MRITAAHEFLPKSPSVHASVVMDHFGVGFETGPHVVAEALELPIQIGDVFCFTGPSGSGKSTLMRAAAAQLDGVLDIDGLDLGTRILVDAIDLPLEESLPLLTSCGLGEARLLLRTPRELSDGQRYRFRLALALSRKPKWIVADEFTATLDRTLAKVVAHNVRRLVDRTGVGVLAATTHEDVVVDLAPNVHVRCRLEGVPQVGPMREASTPTVGAASSAGDRLIRNPTVHQLIGRPEDVVHSSNTPAGSDSTTSAVRRLSLLDTLEITTGRKRDYDHVARWHYRSHHLGIARFVTLLWHGDDPIGICVFTSAPLSLSQRNRFFGISPKRTRTGIRVLDRQIVMLSRVVLHPTWRGAGVAARFVRASCAACPWPWIETLAEMGHLNPFFEKAGFVRVGVCEGKHTTRSGHSDIYGAPTRHGRRKPAVTQETHEKSRFARPVYYIFDNRENAGRREPAEAATQRLRRSRPIRTNP